MGKKGREKKRNAIAVFCSNFLVLRARKRRGKGGGVERVCWEEEKGVERKETIVTVRNAGFSAIGSLVDNGGVRGKERGRGRERAWESFKEKRRRGGGGKR